MAGARRAFPGAVLFADVIGDVQPAQVSHRERPHGHAPIHHGFIDDFGRRSFFDQKLRLANVLQEHPVSHEPAAVADQHPDFPDFLGKLHARGNHVLAALFPANHFQQPHHVRRTEKVHPDHGFRTRSARRDFVNVQRRSVGRKNRAALAHPIQFREHFLLQRHAFEYSFDHHVRGGEILAAGLGTRMRPLTDKMPKPLVKVAGKPLIDHVLDRLVDAGVELAVVNIHYFADQMQHHLALRRYPRISISDERGLLWEPAAVSESPARAGRWALFSRQFRHHLDRRGETRSPQLAETFDPLTMDALLLLAPMIGSIGYSGRGDFIMASDGRLRARAEQEIAPFVYAGAAILSPALFNDTPAGELSLTSMFDRASQAGRLHGLRLDRSGCMSARRKQSARRKLRSRRARLEFFCMLSRCQIARTSSQFLRPHPSCRR